MVIAGTNALIKELVQTPGLEVLPIRADADLACLSDVAATGSGMRATPVDVPASFGSATKSLLLVTGEPRRGPSTLLLAV